LFLELINVNVDGSLMAIGSLLACQGRFHFGNKYILERTAAHSLTRMKLLCRILLGVTQFDSQFVDFVQLAICSHREQLAVTIELTFSTA
jgi:hypothetical protein